MQLEDFYIRNEDLDPGNPWGSLAPIEKIDLETIRILAKGPLPDDDDLATTSALTRLARQEYEAYGTDGSQLLSDEESSEVLWALRLALVRHGIELRPPWRDFASFRAYWNANGGYGSWQARRNMINDVFVPVTEALGAMEDRRLINDLVEPVSPHGQTGWPLVDDHIEQLRHRFRTASTVQDYKDVGNRCVGVLEALSATVYDPTVHCPSGEKVPPHARTNIRIGAYVDERLPGSANSELRGLVNKTSALAHKMKHSPRADRTSTGITADTVIALANILRRLRDSELPTYADET